MCGAILSYQLTLKNNECPKFLDDFGMYGQSSMLKRRLHAFQKGSILVNLACNLL